MADLEALGTQFDQISTEFDDNSAAKGCDKYDLSGGDDKAFEQVIALAQLEAPGTVGFLQYLNNFSEMGGDGTDSGGGSTDGSLPTDCDGSIAALEPYIDSGKNIMELTMEEVTRASTLLGSVAALCSPEKSAEYFQRPEVVAFYGTS
jgi:hypothetical protein